MKDRCKLSLILCIVVSLCCALYLNFQRYQVERANRQVSLAAEYENLRKLAALEGRPEAEVLASFKAAGIDSLMIFDTTLERLAANGQIKAISGTDLAQAALLGAELGPFQAVLSQEQPQKNAVYIAQGEDAATFADLQEDLVLRYGRERVSLVAGRRDLLRVLGSTALVPEDKYDEPLGLWQAPLGLPRRDMQRVAEAGFSLLIRPQNYTAVRQEQIDSIFRRLEGSGVKAAALMPCGKEVVGYPDQVAYLGKKLKERGLPLVLLEHYTQLQFVPIDGYRELAEAVDYRVGRSYVIDGLEQKKLSVAEALRRWALTDEERNIRVNYIRPFFQSREGRPLLSMNLDYVKAIKASVLQRGYSLGAIGLFSAPGQGYAPYFPPRWTYVVLAWGILAAAWLLAGEIFKAASKYLLLGLLASGLLVSLLFFLGRGLVLRQALALLAVTSWPVLAMALTLRLLDRLGRGGTAAALGRAFCLLALAVAVSLGGGLFLSALLGDSRFFLELDIYRGVKLTFILPVVGCGLLCLSHYDLLHTAGRGLGTLCRRVRQLLSQPLTYKYVLLLGVLAFVAYYFVGRSGHGGGVPVPALELKMRTFLEEVMYARPREKEFLIGHPAFFLLVYAGLKGWPKWAVSALGVAAVIGQGSLAQTFCHMRTPVIMTIWRALDGYLLGAALGCLLVLAAALLLPLAGSLWRKLQDS